MSSFLPCDCTHVYDSHKVEYVTNRVNGCLYEVRGKCSECDCMYYYPKWSETT